MSENAENEKKIDNPENSESKNAHNAQVCKIFTSVHKRYDLLNHVLSFGADFWWRHRLVNSIILGEKSQVLDMAAGTLDVSLAISRKYPHALILAGDICEKMLEFGNEKLRKVKEKTGTVNITTQVMDAQEIAMADESFDVVTIAFGIRNVEDRLKALKEMRRVLVNGGQLCILEFGPVRIPFLGKAYHWYLKNIMPKIAKLILKKEATSYEYLAKTIEDFPIQKDFVLLLKEAGFQFIRYEKLTLGIVTLYVAIKT